MRYCAFLAVLGLVSWVGLSEVTLDSGVRLGLALFASATFGVVGQTQVLRYDTEKAVRQLKWMLPWTWVAAVLLHELMFVSPGRSATLFRDAAGNPAVVYNEARFLRALPHPLPFTRPVTREVQYLDEMRVQHGRVLAIVQFQSNVKSGKPLRNRRQMAEWVKSLVIKHGANRTELERELNDAGYALRSER